MKSLMTRSTGSIPSKTRYIASSAKCDEPHTRKLLHVIWRMNKHPQNVSQFAAAKTMDISIRKTTR